MAFSSAEKKDLRKRSVDNLQRLYTIVAGLSVTTAVSRIVGNPQQSVTPISQVLGVDLQISALPMFVAFLLTLIPFYHGANRYLDAAYIFSEDRHHSQPIAAVVDFIFFFVQAALFYAMALVMTDAGQFFRLYLWLLAWDCIWLATVWFQQSPQFEGVKWWLVTNIFCLMLLWVLTATPLLPDDGTRWLLAAVIAALRTAVDYAITWEFYWPGFAVAMPSGKRQQPRLPPIPAVTDAQ